MQERTIIDGQQRLTTLQLLLDALHAELMAVASQAPAMRLEPLVRNAEPFCLSPRIASRSGQRIVTVLRSTQSWARSPQSTTTSLGIRGADGGGASVLLCTGREWLSLRGSARRSGSCSQQLETVVRDLLQMVVIDLGADENAQEIFETLNARGAQLTAADLIKNLVFQRSLRQGRCRGRVRELLEGI